MNVVDYTTPGNRPLKISEIKAAVPELLEKIKGYEKIIALGNTASKALDIAGVKHFKMPHPSGRNFFWNCPRRTEQKVLQLTEFVLS